MTDPIRPRYRVFGSFDLVVEPLDSPADPPIGPPPTKPPVATEDPPPGEPAHPPDVASPPEVEPPPAPVVDPDPGVGTRPVPLPEPETEPITRPPVLVQGPPPVVAPDAAAPLSIDGKPITYRLGVGWAVVPLVLPPGMARNGIRIGGLPTQFRVRNRWPDGSIRYGVGVVPVLPVHAGDFHFFEANVQVESDQDVKPKNPAASVRFTIDGVPYIAELPRQPSEDVWMSGPMVDERRYLVTPVGPKKDPHPTLRVIFEVRTHADGAMRLEVVAENVLNKPGAGTIAYDVEVLSGKDSIFLRKGVRHTWMKRWRKVFPLDGLVESEVRFDFRPFERAGAFPHYLADVAPQDYSVPGPTFDILGAGYINPNMGSPGASSDIGPLPDWTGRYLAQQRPEQRAVTLANGDLAGSFAFHLREPEGGTYPGLGADRLISIVERPDFWSDYRGHAGQMLEGLVDGALGIKTSHVGSYSYIPYLVTGDRYYADEMKFMANFELLNDWGSQDYPRGAAGLVINPGTMGRQAAWILRDLADAAAYVPDADPSKGYFRALVRNNLDWLDWYAKNGLITFGVAWLSGGATTTPDGVEHDVVQPWMHNYLAYAIDHANLQGFAGGTKLRDQIVGFQLRLFTSPDEYPREYAAPGFISRSDRHLDPGGNWVHEFYTTLAQAFRGSFPPGTGPTPFVGYYGNDAALVLQLAIREGLPGAREAYDWLMVQPGMLDYLRNRAGWHVQLVPGLEAPDILAGANIIDDTDPDCTLTGGWGRDNGGWGGSYRYAAAGDGSSWATWDFDVAPGRKYEVWATWVEAYNRATDAPYVIRDGAEEVAGVRINQRKVPATYTPRAGSWQELATVTPRTGRLTVTLSNQADEYVIADAVAVKVVE